MALVIDDGSIEEIWEAILTEHYVLNRFTPPEFPILLDELEVYIPDAPIPALTEHLAVFLDPDGNPSNGADLLRVVVFTTTVFDQFVSVPVDPPLLIQGPGEVLIGLDSGGGPFVGIDTDNHQNRSFFCIYEVPWQMPCTLFPVEQGNLMIRGFGTVAVPVELESFSVE